MNFRNYFVFIFIALIAACSAPVATTTYSPEQEKALLWEITGKGIKKPSYLFGTIHMIEKSDFFLPSETEGSFAKTEKLALEIDMDDPGLMMAMMKGMMMKGGVQIKDLVSAEDYALLEAKFKEELGMGLEMLGGMKPLLLSTMLTEQGMQGEIVSYETEFMEMAEKRDLEIVGLESASFQMSVFDSIPYNEQAEMLLDALKDEGSDEDPFGEMVALYKDQDIQGLKEVISDESSEYADFEDILLKTRNENWIPVIQGLINEQPTFIAVGAGHLGGEYGVINLLRKEGLHLRPMR